MGMGIPMGMGMGWVWGLKFNPHGSPRAAVGMGIPMGMGMGWVWGLKFNPHSSPGYLTLNNIVTLKFGLEVTQGHSKWYRSKA